MSEPTERDPLIQNAQLQQTLPGSATAPPPTEELGSSPKHLGPLEISRTTRYGILAGIWIATFLSSMNTTLVATLLPTISSEFQRSHQASWLGTSYLLATCTFTPLYGRLCNVMGRRGANQLAVALAGLGTLACGLSGNMEMLIVARFLGGMGGGGAFTTSTIITSDMYSIRSRGLAQGIASVFNSLGMGLGGPIGGLISDWLGWRWAFLLQMPLFLFSFLFTSWHLHYVTPGKIKRKIDVLKRIDYGGSLTLLGAVGSCLVFLSLRYNGEQPWSDPLVITSLALSVVFAVAFVVIELYFAPEPVLAPFLLKQKVPVLVGISNFLVANCNFAIQYFYPMWFQTVLLTSASVAGLHVLPNSMAVSVGSLFAGWMMHKTGKYKMINLIFGICPFIGAVLVSTMREDSNPVHQWIGIVPLGFGNSVVLQTMLIALLAHLPRDAMAVGTGFGQLFRGVGQVGGVAISSAIFQSSLDRELRRRIDTPDADELIKNIRHSARFVAELPPDLQRKARDSYAVGLRAVFITAACSTLLAYIARLPIPDKDLEHSPRKQAPSGAQNDSQAPTPSQSKPVTPSIPGTPVSELANPAELRRPTLQAMHAGKRSRRLSTYESADSVMDMEDDRIGGSARR
ncbi:vacuolar amino acid permease [Gloeophyllum trabeum ATCC 11539]|uniref:Vacuolar amino acid permease n=1 Tax=Gloeophyllum trabeum (strain ATCC 11539 / FP-39264 / Madison 617) TaxID=670483 RepID=S7PTD6_GLOTA|nr:vacuolar amino acid permease [Gloeophyllum trabeum ATCC 11539]EPQ50683.1 vacuolar amino acid permease [Gloeophyllum trabeum ATCC 11539]